MNGSSVISTLRSYLELVGVGVYFLPPFFDYKSALWTQLPRCSQIYWSYKFYIVA